MSPSKVPAVGFDSLPAELRAKIYDHCSGDVLLFLHVRQRCPGTVKAHSVTYSSKLQVYWPDNKDACYGLLKASRTMRTELFQRLAQNYPISVDEFNMRSPCCSPGPPRGWRPSAFPPAMQKLRNIELRKHPTRYSILNHLDTWLPDLERVTYQIETGWDMWHQKGPKPRLDREQIEKHIPMRHYNQQQMDEYLTRSNRFQSFPLRLARRWRMRVRVYCASFCVRFNDSATDIEGEIAVSLR